MLDLLKFLRAHLPTHRTCLLVHSSKPLPFFLPMRHTQTPTDTGIDIEDDTIVTGLS